MKAYALIRLFLKDTGEYSRLKRYYFYFSLKAYIVMLAVNIMLFKEYPSFKLFLQNTMSIKSFMKACREDNFKMTKEDILNYNVLSSEVKMSILNANKVSK